MEKKELNLSLTLLKKIFIGGFSFLIGVLGYYQIINGERYFQRAKNNYVKVIPLTAIRGEIFDRNGVKLSYDRAMFNISVIPYQIRNVKDELFQQLSNFLDYDRRQLYKNYDRNLQNFFSPVDIIIDIDKRTALTLKAKFNDLILITTQPKRYYPYPYQFSHLLGYVKKATIFYESLKKYGYKPSERVGISGIEQYYDTYLKGQSGGAIIEADAKGRVVGFLGEQLPKKGKDIYLTVDSRIQKVAYETLGKRRGVIILMDSYTGEIIALHSSPAFNPNDFINGKDLRKILSDIHSPLLNRAHQAVYPIGSTFKPLVGVAALEEKVGDPFTQFVCEGQLKLGLAQFRCWRKHGPQNLYEALAASCNVYFYNLGLRLGPAALSRWAKKFGLGSPTGVDLPSEISGFVPSVSWKQKKRRQNWFAGDTVNFSIGQGFLRATPLEIMRAINVFANGGYLVTPHLLKEVDSLPSGLTTKTFLRISDRNLRVIQEGLRQAVVSETGTAHILSRLNLRLSGKTGTAQTRGKSHAWFIGFFPYKKNKYTICIFLEHGASSYEAVKATYYFLKTIVEKDFL